MSNERYKDWVEYYYVKGSTGGELKQISGYTHGLAQLTENGLKDIIDTAKSKLSLKDTDRLLDVGCGVGLLTQYLAVEVGNVVGLDVNRGMLAHGTGNGKFDLVEASADNLPFSNSGVNKIFCHSIFQYFPDYRYALLVIQEMRRVLVQGGRALVMDIPDIDKKDTYLKVKTPDTHNLERTYYSKEWFTNLGSDIEVFEQPISDYGNSQYRFNVVILR